MKRMILQRACRLFRHVPVADTRIAQGSSGYARSITDRAYVAKKPKKLINTIGSFSSLFFRVLPET